MDDRRRAPSAVSWSELPPEILSSIQNRLKNRVDFFRFRSVCKNWRSSQNPNPNLLSSFLPRKISNLSLPFLDKRHDPILLFARTVLLVQPLNQSPNPSYWILTVEEIEPGKLRILYPLSKDRVTNLSSNFPKSLNLLDFDVSEMANGYGFKFASDERDVCGVDKVVLSSDCSTAMVLYGKGTLVGVRLKNGNWGYVRQSLVSSFSDVINFKGMIYAIDRGGDRGNVYVVDHKTMTVIKTIALKYSLGPSCQKRLLESNGKLCLVCWYIGPLKGVSFVVRRLDEVQRVWASITNLTPMLLFMSFDSCFYFNFGGQNFYPFYITREEYSQYSENPLTPVIYSQHCLDSFAGHPIVEHKLFEAASVHLPLGIYLLRGSTESTRDIASLTAEMLWPPPTWFWPDTYSASGDEEENEELDFCNQAVPSEIPTMDAPSAAHDVQIGEQALKTEIPGMNVHSIDRDSHAFIVQDFNPPGKTFERYSIKSNLIPTLEKIWEKHGNITEGSTLRNTDMISRALESLAMAVLILKKNTGRSLSKTEADYLSSSLSDLQQMGFKVGWLVPFVDKALAIHKSRPLVDSLKEFGEAKARVQESKLKVLDELAKLDEVEEDLTLVLEKIPVLEEVDLNKCLGEGLY